MRTARNIAFVLLILSFAVVERARAGEFSYYDDWIAYHQSICDGGFWAGDDLIVGGASCECAGSAPSACWDYISGGTGSDFCQGYLAAAESHCGAQWSGSPTCGLHEFNYGCTNGSADWTCKPLCAGENYPCYCYPF